MTDVELKNIFSYHPPSEEDKVTYDIINETFLIAAWRINDLLPPGPGATVAIRKLADARMAANAAVALKGRF